MRRAEVGADYDATVGAMHRLRAGNDGNEPGDPARAAAILVEVAALDQPPRRLLLGAAAVDAAVEAGAERAAETERWADLGRSADFPV
jgi:hypothetical protein